MGALVGEDAGAADFRAGTGGSGHGDDRGDAPGVGAGPPVADVFIVPDRARLAAHEGDQLAHVQAAAAAEGDHPVVLAGVVGSQAGVEVGAHRIGLEIAEDCRAEAGILQQGEGGGGDRCRTQAAIGDQQRALHAEALAQRRQLLDTPGAEAYRGGVVPVGGLAHGTGLVETVMVRRTLPLPFTGEGWGEGAARPSPPTLLPQVGEGSYKAWRRWNDLGRVRCS